MLSYLRVRSLALLDDVALTFEPGMNVLTGETGAGKSIIVGALALLRGARGRAEFVRDGDASAIIDAQFEPRAESRARLRAMLEHHGLPDDDDALVLQRVVARSGRGRSFAQGSLTTQAVLGALGEELIDICSQHEHHFLTHTGRHLDVLDAYAGNDAARADYAAKYEAWTQAKADLSDLRARLADGAARADFLRYQLEEIDRIAPEAGELDALRRRVNVLRGARDWVSFAHEAQHVLYESDGAVASTLGGLADRARAGADDSATIGELAEQLTAASVAAEEAASLAARLLAELELDPVELERAEDRLHELESLRRKHGVELEQLLERVLEMRSELDAIENADDHLQALESRTDELSRNAAKAARSLSQRRRRAAPGLARAVEAELDALSIRSAQLEVKVGEASLSPTGADAVELLFSANAGEPVAPLRKVASGGELSRVLLAIKGVLAAGDRVATYVFDEVDAGVGGAVAEAIGRRLERAAAEHQVLCVTHLPQIAAFADAHFRVEKRSAKGRTTTRVVCLDETQRVEELARMLGGKRVTQSARDHAKALIKAAKTAKSTGRARRTAKR
ncbi:MAG: DNA repair protein RecN [Nannocystaceae bacterium]|nr:DNA repair protein RecN [bacterium]